MPLSGVAVPGRTGDPGQGRPAGSRDSVGPGQGVGGGQSRNTGAAVRSVSDCGAETTAAEMGMKCGVPRLLNVVRSVMVMRLCTREVSCCLIGSITITQLWRGRRNLDGHDSPHRGGTAMRAVAVWWESGIPRRPEDSSNPASRSVPPPPPPTSPRIIYHRPGQLPTTQHSNYLVA